MDEVSISEELECAGELLQEVANYDLVQGAFGRVRVLRDHVTSETMVLEGVPALDEE